MLVIPHWNSLNSVASQFTTLCKINLRKTNALPKRWTVKSLLVEVFHQLRVNSWNGLFYMSRSSLTVSCKPGFLTEQCWWGVQIPGKLPYKFVGPRDKGSTIQEDCRRCTPWHSTQIYTKAFFHFQNSITLHVTRATVISLTPTKICLARYDFHRNTHTQKYHVQIAWTEEHKFINAANWRVWISFCQFSVTSNPPNKRLWTSPVLNFIPIGWKMQKIWINVYLQPYVQFEFRFTDFHKLAIFNSIMWRHCTPNLTHQLRNMGGTGISWLTPESNLW